MRTNQEIMLTNPRIDEDEEFTDVLDDSMDLKENLVGSVLSSPQKKAKVACPSSAKVDTARLHSAKAKKTVVHNAK